MKSSILRDLYAQHPPDVQQVVGRVLQIEKEFLSYQKSAATRRVKGPLDELITEIASRSLATSTTDATPDR